MDRRVYGGWSVGFRSGGERQVWGSGEIDLGRFTDTTLFLSDPSSGLVFPRVRVGVDISPTLPSSPG